MVYRKSLKIIGLLSIKKEWLEGKILKKPINTKKFDEIYSSFIKKLLEMINIK